MGRIIRLQGADHRELQDLLPWYVTGQLEASEHAQVEAHLNTCPECQAEVAFQRRLGAEIADLPIGVEQSWREMRRRLELEPPIRARRSADGWLMAVRRKVGRGWSGGAPWLGWAMAGVLLSLSGAMLLPPAQSARYHALGASAAPPAGNVVVVFRPDMRERDLRALLNASHARLVDGPTATDAYVLHVPSAERAAALAKLRGRADIVLAEPVDAGAGR